MVDAKIPALCLLVFGELAGVYKSSQLDDRYEVIVEKCVITFITLQEQMHHTSMSTELKSLKC